MRSVLNLVIVVAVSHSIALLHATTHAAPTVVNAKCTPNDPRTRLYPECMQGDESLILWCDHSSHTSIPAPDTIYQTKLCNDSLALFVNDSCLPELRQDEIRKYPLIENLQVGKNLITRISSYAFKYNKKLRTVGLDANYIQTIQRDAFSGMDKLETLDLTNNRLSRISDSAIFRGLRSLKELYLEGNQIQVLRSYAFRYLPSLEVLVLRGNKISHIDRKAFQGLQNLRRLHLDGNELSTLDKGCFLYTPKLRVLTLSYNKFSVAPTFYKNSLLNLRTLNLGHNFLREVEVSRMANLSKLQNLSLENNSIPEVSEDSFREMPSLRFLNLSSNGIDTISQCAFSNNCHLEILNLSNNTLETPHPEWFTTVLANNAASGTKISGNQWKCDCEAIRFHEFYSELSPVWKKALTITCNWPKEHVGKPLSDVIQHLKDDPKCSNKRYNKVERICNVSVPEEDPVDTTIYTYVPTTTDDETPDITTYLATAKTLRAPAFEEQERIVDLPPKDDAIKSRILAIACAVFGTICVCLLIYAIITRRRKHPMCDEEKSDSTEKILPPPSTNSRCDSTLSSESRSRSSMDTIRTTLSSSSQSSYRNGSVSESPDETTPFQPQDDLKSNFSASANSDSGCPSSPSSFSPSDVALSEGSTDSGRSTLPAINEDEVFFTTQQTFCETVNETTPKRVVTQNPVTSQDDGEYLMMQVREQPIGGNADDGIH